MISIIESCQGWDGGNYDENPKQCASNALSELIPYFYTREWWDQYVDTPEAYTRWRNAGATTTSTSRMHGISTTRTMACAQRLDRRHAGLQRRSERGAGSIKAKTLFIGSPQDLFYLPHHIETQVKAIPNARAVWIDSAAGSPDLLQRRSECYSPHGRCDRTSCSNSYTQRSADAGRRMKLRECRSTRKCQARRSVARSVGIGVQRSSRPYLAAQSPRIPTPSRKSAPASCPGDLQCRNTSRRRCFRLEGIAEDRVRPHQNIEYIPDALLLHPGPTRRCGTAVELIPYMDADEPVVVPCWRRSSVFSRCSPTKRVRWIRDLKEEPSP